MSGSGLFGSSSSSSSSGFTISSTVDQATVDKVITKTGNGSYIVSMSGSGGDGDDKDKSSAVVLIENSASNNKDSSST